MNSEGLCPFVAYLLRPGGVSRSSFSGPTCLQWNSEPRSQEEKTETLEI